jgi:hypothetical protein
MLCPGRFLSIIIVSKFVSIDHIIMYTLGI